jgi:hypothetical protein
MAFVFSFQSRHHNIHKLSISTVVILVLSTKRKLNSNRCEPIHHSTYSTFNGYSYKYKVQARAQAQEEDKDKDKRMLIGIYL